MEPFPTPMTRRTTYFYDESKLPKRSRLMYETVPLTRLKCISRSSLRRCSRSPS
jgi:hypothetical protein